MAFFSSVATIALAVSLFYLLLGPMVHFGVRCVRKVFDQLGIEWKVIEERILAVVSDGAGTMGAYVGLLNDIRAKGRKELIGWVKDAAHCLMRAISTAKGKVKLWYDALDDPVSFLACLYRTSSKRIRGLWRKGGKFCFSRRTGVRWVEAMTWGVGRRPRACSMRFRTPSSSSRRPFFAMFLLWFVPQARKFKQPRGHGSPPSRV